MRFRGLALVFALAAWFVGAVPAAADDQGETYLALGDSVAFGTSPLVDPRNADNSIGYPSFVGQTLQMKVVNSACPGEATGGFISSTGLDNVCRPYRSLFPLHVAYTGTQLAFAVNFLKQNPDTSLVTLGLDANDLFRLSTGPGPDVWPPSTCFVPVPADLAGLVEYFVKTPTGAVPCAVQNLTTILSAIRGTGYQGPIVMVLYYALNYSDPVGVFGAHDLLNQAMVTAGTPFHVFFADGFTAFQNVAAPFGGDSCKAGLLIVVNTSPLACNIHPSSTGQALLAKTVVNALENNQGQNQA